MEKFKKSLLAFGMFIIVVQALTPVYFMFKYSISDRNSIVTGGDIIPLWPYEPTLDIYRYVLSDSYIMTVVGNSLKVTIITLVLSLIMGVCAAYILAKINFFIKNVFLIFLISVRFFPDIITVIPITEVFIRLNLDSTIVGVGLGHTLLALPYVIFIMMAGFETVPKDLEAQALNLGASKLQAFLYVVLPVVLPSVAVSAIYVFILSWDEFIFSYFILGFGEIETLPVYIKKMLGFQPPQNMLMAVAMILTLPVLIFTFFIQKYIISDIREGAIK